MRSLAELVAQSRRDELPFDMFDADYSDAEALRARRLENIYHVGQNRLWDGRAVLAELIAKHGRPELPMRFRKPLARIFSIIMWGELAAWKISAQLADVLKPLEPKLAASSQVHDEARHFYVMHDYLVALGERPLPLDRWAHRVLDRVMRTPRIAHKILGMQLTVESTALAIFQAVRELRVEPVLTELLPYFERDEARHVGLGTQLVPSLVAGMSLWERLALLRFQTEIDLATLLSLKSMERDFASIDVDVRDLLAIGFKKHLEVVAMMREQGDGPADDDPATTRIFHGLCEGLFPDEGPDAQIAWYARVTRGLAVAARRREGVLAAALRRRKQRSVVAAAASEAT